MINKVIMIHLSCKTLIRLNPNKNSHLLNHPKSFKARLPLKEAILYSTIMHFSNSSQFMCSNNKVTTIYHRTSHCIVTNFNKMYRNSPNSITTITIIIIKIFNSNNTSKLIIFPIKNSNFNKCLNHYRIIINIRIKINRTPIKIHRCRWEPINHFTTIKTRITRIKTHVPIVQNFKS
jgi:hypothetical protein